MEIKWTCPSCKKTETYYCKTINDYIICWHCLKAYFLNGEFKSQSVSV